jgi:hypothetical protein
MDLGVALGVNRLTISLIWSSARGVKDSTRSRYPRSSRDEEPAAPCPFGRDEITSSKTKGREDGLDTVLDSTVTVADRSDTLRGKKEDIFVGRFQFFLRWSR